MVDLKRGPIPIEVRPALDPDGERRVLLQLPNSFVLLWPEDARRVADLLREVAKEVRNE